MTLRFFSDDNDNLIEDIQRALVADDYVAAKGMVHTVKGLAGTLSAETLAQSARELEVAIMAKERDLSVLLRRFELELKQVMTTAHCLIAMHMCESRPVSADAKISGP